jgi:hypothetical protein
VTGYAEKAISVTFNLTSLGFGFSPEGWVGSISSGNSFFNSLQFPAVFFDSPGFVIGKKADGPKILRSFWHLRGTAQAFLYASTDLKKEDTRLGAPRGKDSEINPRLLGKGRDAF